MSAHVLWQGKMLSGAVARVVATPATARHCATVSTEIEATDALGVSTWIPAQLTGGESLVIGALCTALLGLAKEPLVLVDAATRPS